MNALWKKIVAGGFAAMMLGGTIASSTSPASADAGATIGAGIFGAAAGAMLGAAVASAAPPPPPETRLSPSEWCRRRLAEPAGGVG
jgi:hypothetical protein